MPDTPVIHSTNPSREVATATPEPDGRVTLEFKDGQRMTVRLSPEARETMVRAISS